MRRKKYNWLGETRDEEYERRISALEGSRLEMEQQFTLVKLHVQQLQMAIRPGTEPEPEEE
jgi:hypothetical protein